MPHYRHGLKQKTNYFLRILLLTVSIVIILYIPTGRRHPLSPVIGIHAKG